jgi:hypothetical protein
VNAVILKPTSVEKQCPLKPFIAKKEKICEDPMLKIWHP